jgi:hypothetical protein
MGIGGLLLGARQNARIRILDFVPIPCSHSQGPSFNLSPDEIKHAQELQNSPGAAAAVVGWYWSKTRRQKGLPEECAALFAALCPAAWQIMLILRPSMAEPSRADLFFRDKGLTVAGPELELHPVETEFTDAAAPLPEPVSVPPTLVAPAAVTPQPVAQPISRPVPAPAAARPALSARPLFATQNAAPRRYWLPWVFAGTLLCAGGGTAAWVTRNDWIPRPPLQLEATESNGQVTFHWNADAVRGLDGATLLVNDGGALHTFPLSQTRLEAGAMDYQRKSPRVTGTLRIGENRAIATYFEPVPETPPAAPVP